MTVVVFGSANTDLTVEVARAPAAGETVGGTAFTTGLGGKGLNQAVAAARLGARTAFVGRVGDDAHGAALVAGLAAAGVDTAGLHRDPAAPSGVALIVVGAGGDNRIVVVPGANGGVGAPDLERLRGTVVAGDVLLVQLELPLGIVVDAVAAAAERGVRVVLDPAPAPAGALPAALHAPHVVLTPNESEGAALVGHPLADDADVHRAVRTLLARGAGAVVLKLGERGICWGDGDGTGWQPALPVRVRDTVGAGDAVNGALGAALDQGATLAEAVRWAAAAGSVAVTRPGAYTAMPTRADVLAHLGAAAPITV